MSREKTDLRPAYPPEGPVPSTHPPLGAEKQYVVAKVKCSHSYSKLGLGPLCYQFEGPRRKFIDFMKISISIESQNLSIEMPNNFFLTIELGCPSLRFKKLLFKF